MSRCLVVCAALLLIPVGTVASVRGALTATPHVERGTPAAQQVPAGAPARRSVSAPDADAAREGTFAVLPFTNISRAAADDWLGDGIAETVAADLAVSPGVSVVGRDRLDSALAGGPGTAVDVRAATELGRNLGARWVVTGGYQRVGDRLRITARLLEAGAGVVADSVTADGTMDEVFDLQDQIVVGLLAGTTPVVAALSPEPQAPVAAEPVPTSEGPGLGDVRRRDEAAQVGRVEAGQGAPVAGTSQPEAPVAGGLILPPPELSARPADAAVGGGLGGPAEVPAVSAGALAGRPSANASFATQPPTIDGTLDDVIWRTATRLTDFVQVTPVEGDPATEETDVFVAFDSTHLYLGMHAHYSNPGTVRASRVDRDRASFSDDTISVYFDTFLDQQRAFVFTLNGYGVQGDSLMGGGGGFRGGGGGGVPRGDRSWDALFDSAGTLVDDGWTAELAIPFKSLRYPSSDIHRWGFQVARSMRNKNETVVWAPVSRDVSGFLPQMGLLDGLRNLSTSRNLEILPTFTGIQVGSLDTATGGFPEERQPEAGVNLKYGLTPNLTLDFTYNPDFSQIESDRPQIEVNQRFPLFFSELRPFFLEGQEIFDIQGPVTFVHTRTIVDPRYGGKITGKVGRTTLGFLFANDEAAGKLDDPTARGFGQSANTIIGRARYDLYSQSHIGAVFTDREFLDGYSRLSGVDTRLQVTPTAQFDFAALTTQNRNVDGLDATSGTMFDGGYRNNGRNLSYNASAYSIDPEFDSQVGFIRRRDIRRVSSSVGYRWWPESWLINWGPEFQYSRNWNFEDVLEDEEARLRLRMSFARNLSFNGDIRKEMERFGGINFDKTRYSLGGNVNTSNLLSFGGSFNWGDQVRFSDVPFLGNGSSGRLFMSVRPHTRLQTFINVNTSRLVDPIDQTDVFDVKIFRAQTTYQFTDRLLLRNILEHNTFSRTLGANLLLTYRVNSGTVFFVGYDDRYQQRDLIFDNEDDPVFFTTDFERTNRAFFTKISYLFRY
jgi:TolB-like protein